MTRDDLKRMADRGPLRVGGVCRWWCHGADGRLKWRSVFNNGAAYVGLNYILETMFRSGTQLTAWYVGLIDGATFSAVSANDTMASHAGWTEFTTYVSANRPAWGPAAAASGVMTNTALFTYAIQADGTLAGQFVTSGQAKSPGNTGTLWATALNSRSVTNGDTLSGDYTITLTPSS
jgi:hypothetical protein